MTQKISVGLINIDSIIACLNSFWPDENSARWNINQDLGTGITLPYYIDKTPEWWVATNSYPEVPSILENIFIEELEKISDFTGLKFSRTSDYSEQGLLVSTAESFVGGNIPTGYKVQVLPHEVVYDREINFFTPRSGQIVFDRATMDNAISNSDYNSLTKAVHYSLTSTLGLRDPFSGYLHIPVETISIKERPIYTTTQYYDAKNDLYDIGLDKYGKPVLVRPEEKTMGILDILGLQKIYGTNKEYHSSDDVYTWSQNSAFSEVIYDAGGKDTIDISKHTMRSYIDLTGDTLSSIGIRVTEEEILINKPVNADNSFNIKTVTYRGMDNLGIIGVIENLNAGSNNDYIIANNADNVINAGNGNDIVFTGAGNDTINLGDGDDIVVINDTDKKTIDGGSGFDIVKLDISVKSIQYYSTTGSFIADNILIKNADLLVTSDGKISGNIVKFDEKYYLDKNPDVKMAVDNGVYYSGKDHWMQHGIFEHRVSSPFSFDEKYYLDKNLDVKKAGIDAYDHFMSYGWKEGRDPNAFFDTSSYIEHNSDIEAASINPYEHFINYGISENRSIYAADFNWQLVI